MLRCLIFLFFGLSFISTSFGFATQEVENFSKEQAWLKLLYYEKDSDGYESLVKSERFFLAPDGRRNPLTELKETIKQFRKNVIHKFGDYTQCVFPARFQVIKERWPEKFIRRPCKDYDEWGKNLDAANLYLVFASAYPNNPASMFGHTFLRFDRKNKSQRKSTNALLGYSFAFQARTDPGDDAFRYTLKGIAGGYKAFLEIKPHYYNVGVYNNSESRDLWDFSLKLTPKEKAMFIAHAWELSVSAYFDYYFFTKNCSSLLLYMLEAILPDLSFKSKYDIFVIPQETLKELVVKRGTNRPLYRPSIKKEILIQGEKFSKDQVSQFSKAMNSLNEVRDLKDPEVLDQLINLWKYRNYQEKTKLSPYEAKMMHETLVARSKIKVSSKPLHIDQSIVDIERPDLITSQSNVLFSIDSDGYEFSSRYGFLDFFDSRYGHDQSSFVRFMNLKYRKDTEINQSNFELEGVNILSLQDFSRHLPAISWNVAASYLREGTHDFGRGEGGIGISRKGDWWQAYSLIALRYETSFNYDSLSPGIHIGWKYYPVEYVMIGAILKSFYLHDKYSKEANIFLTYWINTISLSANFYHDSKVTRLGPRIIWNF